MIAGDGWLRRPARWRPASRRRAVLLLTGLVLLVAVPLAVPALIMVFTWGDRYSERNVPAAPVAIVLGAGLDASGRPSAFLAERVSLAVRLYQDGKVHALLMSGDNSRRNYDEVGAMATLAERLGVPAAAIVQDHAGFDTYSSCYRARSVWGISRAIVVTQPFHLSRAVWLCRELGVAAVGAQTGADNGSGRTWYGWFREIPALDKAALDVWRDRAPIFPGPREHLLDGVNAAA